MQIAVLSGKGGTGKTSVSTNLAALSPDTLLLDCDVEEPNAQLFMKPSGAEEETVFKGFPLFDEEKCTHCRKCSSFCRFHAILGTPAVTISMKELCHDCGGCAIVCPSGAVSYDRRRIGRVVSGTACTGSVMAYGEMDTGEYSGVGVIQSLKKRIDPEGETLLDCPPGTACAAVAALDGCDFALIVTEPTPFALSDMKMVVDMVREIKLPAAVVVNKAGMGDREVYDYCEKENLPVLGEIPFSLEAAGHYADGELTVNHIPEFRILFQELWTSIRKAVREL